MDRDKKNNSQFLISTKLFAGLDFNTFMKYYYSFFTFQKIDKGKFVHLENDLSEDIYIIKKGEFSINKFFPLKEFYLVLRYYIKSIIVPDVDEEIKMAG